MPQSLNDRLRIREWERLRFHDPAVTLRRLRALEYEIARYNVDPKVRELRTNRLKKIREWREIALFCYGIGAALGTPVYYSTHESADYDSVTCWRTGDTGNFAPLQLKEWVPAELNPRDNLDAVLATLGKYTGSAELTVAVHVNREGILNVRDIRIPKLNIAELWLFGATSWAQDNWMLYGDLLKEPHLYPYSYPAQ